MKTELLALIENYGKALVHQTEGKISAFKDAKNLMSNIVFLLDKATMNITLDFKQATELLEMFGGEPCEISLSTGTGHSGEGLYAAYTDLPEEGTSYLGISDDEALPTPKEDPAPAVPKWIDDPHDIEQGQMLNPEWSKLQSQAHPAVEPVLGDLLPPIGSKVFIRHGRDDDAHACIVTGYYVWGDLGGDKRSNRVFVSMVYEGSDTKQARMLCDCYPTAEAALTEQAPAAVEPVAQDLLSHKAPWRDAIQQMATRGLTSGDDEHAYWRHELMAFDTAFDALEATTQTDPADALDAETIQKAKRYDWLRNEAWGGNYAGTRTPHVVVFKAGLAHSLVTELAEEALDEEIDAAIAAQAAQKNGGV